MIRSRISLDDEAYREAKRQARQQGISLAEFLRRLVATTTGIEANRSVDSPVYGQPRP